MLKRNSGNDKIEGRRRKKKKKREEIMSSLKNRLKNDSQTATDIFTTVQTTERLTDWHKQKAN